MTVYDVHAHLMTEEGLAAMSSCSPEMAARLVEVEGGYELHYPGRERLGPIPRSMLDVDLRLADMDERRVDVQVLAVPPPQFHYHVDAALGQELARIQNDVAIDVSDRHPDRFHVFATLPLQDPLASVKELERVVEHSRVRGVEIGTNVRGANLDAAELEPLWDALEATGVPVWVHPDQRAIAGPERLSSYYLRNLIGNPLESTIAIACLIFGGVPERHPRLRFGFVHGGGFAPYQIGRWDHGWACRSEPSAAIPDPPSVYFRRMFFDSLTHDRSSLELLGRRVGWAQVVLGSDYPFDMASADPVGGVEDLHLCGADQEAVLCGNAERFLRPLQG
ncbi:MAG: amidohydrolase family protein [Acidimicrobiales bacterium]